MHQERALEPPPTCRPCSGAGSLHKHSHIRPASGGSLEGWIATTRVGESSSQMGAGQGRTRVSHSQQLYGLPRGEPPTG